MPPDVIRREIRKRVKVTPIPYRAKRAGVEGTVLGSIRAERSDAAEQLVVQCKSLRLRGGALLANAAKDVHILPHQQEVFVGRIIPFGEFDAFRHRQAKV